MRNTSISTKCPGKKFASENFLASPLLKRPSRPRSHLNIPAVHKPAATRPEKWLDSFPALANFISRNGARKSNQSNHETLAFAVSVRSWARKKAERRGRLRLPAATVTAGVLLYSRRISTRTAWRRIIRRLALAATRLPLIFRTENMQTALKYIHSWRIRKPKAISRVKELRATGAPCISTETLAPAEGPDLALCTSSLLHFNRNHC